MTIPLSDYYQKKTLGNGAVATIEGNTVNTITAGGEIGFGCAVDIQDGKAVVATKAPIFGIAIRRTWTEAEHFYEDAIQNDKFQVGETLGVLRKGGISVPVSSDVNRYDPAAVASDGTFKQAGASDQVVGRFLTAGDSGSTAIVQVNITDTGTGTVTATSTAQTNTDADSGTDNSKQGGNK